jgi:hypothetical protein
MLTGSMTRAEARIAEALIAKLAKRAEVVVEHYLPDEHARISGLLPERKLPECWVIYPNKHSTRNLSYHESRADCIKWLEGFTAHKQMIEDSKGTRLLGSRSA